MASETRSRYIEVIAVARNLKFAEELVRFDRDSHELVQARVTLGNSAPLERSQVWVELNRAETALIALESKMEQASLAQDYETAAAYRDQIRTLRAVRQKQFVSSDKARDLDIAALVAEGGMMCVNLVSVRAGQHRGDKSFFPEHAEGR